MTPDDNRDFLPLMFLIALCLAAAILSIPFILMSGASL